MASPNKNMKTSEYKHSFESGYAPYKMLGHELPGPNQYKAPNKALEKTHINDQMVDGVSKRSGALYTEGGVGSSPAKGWFKNLTKKLNPVNHIKNLVKGVKGGDMKSILSGGVLGGGEDPAVAGAEGGADHTHPEFAQLDEAMQGATEDGGVENSIAGIKQKTGAGMWGGIGKRIGAFSAQEEELV